MNDSTTLEPQPPTELNRLTDEAASILSDLEAMYPDFENTEIHLRLREVVRAIARMMLKEAPGLRSYQRDCLNAMLESGNASLRNEAGAGKHRSVRLISKLPLGAAEE